MKNSISVIAAFLEDALSEMGGAGTEASPVARTLTHQALYEAQRVNGHLIQIMAIYKMSQGRYPFDPEDVELAGFAAEAAARVRPLAATKGVHIEVVLDPRAGDGGFDRELVFSVIVQSLFNAIRYARERVRLGVAQRDGHIEIRVEDDGAGFPPFMLERGFADQTAINTRTASTGLGLYFARRVAQMHRHGGHSGDTRLENGGTLGGGCFVLTLP